MDFRLTDNIADPSSERKDLYSEKLIRLPYGFLCYRPESTAPPVAPLPCLDSGSITFGSFNNLSKVTPEVVRLWAKILRAVNGSRLILKSKGFSDRETASRFKQMFAEEGIGAERLQLYGLLASTEEHLGLYRKVDIGLDPFPYNGTTTTCESRWMGVPVVTLLGDRHSGRVGASIMHSTGLGGMVAENSEHYMQLAVSLAGDKKRLESLRQGLRQQLQQSPLMESRRFTRELEAEYRKMWSSWCKSVR
jgi:predicted O-linked N-acetylglucosamine transferase (SPINDLY family)